MTDLHILGSGSKGNAFALAAEGRVVLVDAGFSAREIQRRLGEARLDPGTIDGIVITHEHGDHARGATRLAALLGCPILTSGGTWRRLKGRTAAVVHRAIGFQGAVELGPFTIQGSLVAHDAAEPLAVRVTATDGTAVGFASDLGRPTAAVRYLLGAVHALVLEANYDEVLLRTSAYPAAVQARIAGSTGHLSNRAAADLVRGLHHAELDLVVLAHLSQQCNTPDRARATVAAAMAEVGYRGRIVIAEQDRVLPALAVSSLSLWASGERDGRDPVAPARPRDVVSVDRSGPG